MFRKFVSTVSNLTLFGTYHLPADALNTASLVKKKSTSVLYKTRNRNWNDAGVPFDGLELARSLDTVYDVTFSRECFGWLTHSIELWWGNTEELIWA